MKTEIDFLIVGQGLAGSLTAWELLKRNKRICVIDPCLEITSSRIAAGMYNPINTKRFTVTANAKEVIQEALLTYREMEQAFNVQLVYPMNVYNVFGNHKESNDYLLKLDHPYFQQYTLPDPIAEPHVHQPFGAFEVTDTGWIHLRNLLDNMRDYLRKQEAFWKDTFNHAALKQVSGGWEYGDLHTQHVVFCEGVQARQNPLFNTAEIIPCKGDVLEFEAPDWHPTRVIKKGVYIVPIQEGVFKCGSTYQWHNGNSDPLDEDRLALAEKLRSLIAVPFTITKHASAVRPTTRTREIIVAKHPHLAGLWMVNGLGTKGVINGVQAVRRLMQTLDV